MPDLVIETTGLSKTYRTTRMRHVVAVEGLDLAVEAGGVHGFLGPNGSGKTTTIRMLLGLARPTAGTMRVFDSPVPSGLGAVMPRVGAVVESPKFLPGFTGRRNLDLLARVGGLSRSRVDAVLEQVDLLERASDRYKGYSLGMRQRLAIAATLLKEPSLLILDEPTNGLDPQGIRDIRQMIRSLGDSGVTVLVSSHILAEIEQVADSVTIVRRGRLIATGPVTDVVGSGVTASLRVRLADLDAAASVLQSSRLAVTRASDHLMVDGADEPADVTRLLAEHGLYVSELTPVRPDLESVFLDLTREDEQVVAS
ncbi:ABC transporter ATP-binding protein [soil metagenome]|jgi:ABC-2 type transport system ATP-binding protein